MSTKLVQQVLDLPSSAISLPERMVLVSIADHFNDETGRCDPSVARLAERCSASRRTIIRSLRSLQEKGLLVVRYKNGSRCQFIPKPVPESHRCQSGTGATQAPEGCHSGTGGVPQWHGTGATVAPEPRTNLQRTKKEPQQPRGGAGSAAEKVFPEDEGTGIVFAVRRGTEHWNLPQDLLGQLSSEFPAVNIQATVTDLADWTFREKPAMMARSIPGFLRRKLAEESVQPAPADPITTNGRHNGSAFRPDTRTIDYVTGWLPKGG